ncbi:MAG TPA: GAF domain-containing protein [Stellaceae bacterium]|nr:GAF domain-containing protein [Stellaceae bacterium]
MQPGSRQDRLLRLLLETATAAIDAEEGSLLLSDSTAGDLRFAMTVGNAESEAKLRGQRVPFRQGIVGAAAVTFEVQIGAPKYHDVEQTERKPGVSNEPEVLVAAPLIAGETLIGVITGASMQPNRRFGSKEAKIYGGFAAIAAILVEQDQRLTAMADRTIATTTSADPAQNRNLGEIDQALGRIATTHPQALAQLTAIIQSFEAALLP